MIIDRIITNGNPSGMKWNKYLGWGNRRSFM